MKKRILLTGAFGNIGSFVINELLLQGFHVIAFDKKTPVTAKNSKRFQHPEVDIYWGDITDKQSVKSAIDSLRVDAVIHLAGIFPPLSENNPGLAKAVNVDGTRNIIEAMEASESAKRLVFASSIAVYGKQQGKVSPPLSVSHPVTPDDHYGEHKAECERMIQDSSLDWSLLRISACPPVNIKNMDSFKGAPLLELHPDSHVEIIHPADVALAFVNAVNCEEARGKIFLLGGGAKNQITTHELVNAMFAALGLKPLPREALQITDEIEFHGDWLDTVESQRVLQFQRYDTQKIYTDFRASFGVARHGLILLKICSPVLHWFILKTSPYYKKQKSTR